MDLEQLRQHFDELRSALDTVANLQGPAILACGRQLVDALQKGHKILVCGNGGSAADAQHLAAELVGRFLRERQGLPAIALTTDSSILTAVGNDYGFDHIFSRQIQALARPRDVVIGISTSGNSKNVFNALQAGKEIGCITVGLLGRDGGIIAPMVDIDLTVPLRDTPVIQTAHGAIIHILCGMVEEGLFGEVNQVFKLPKS
jgi:D-sedoheptulose 7-phosphate isomerase